MAYEAVSNASADAPLIDFLPASFETGVPEWPARSVGAGALGSTRWCRKSQQAL
jgi:hypothetical protein